MEWLETQIQVLEQEIERRVVPYEAAILQLITIPGIDRKTAWTILAEIGVEMSVFGDARHLASWAGLCPGNRESGGKRMSGRTRKANRYVKRAMCQAAWAASHTKQTYLSAFYRRMCVRRGAPKAIMALAHHLLTVVFQVLSRNEEYVEFGADFYDRQNRPKVAASLVARLTRLGYHVDLHPAESDIPGGQSEPLEQSIQPLESDTESAGTSPAAVPVRRKRGRPCKCAERGIICKHGGTAVPISLNQQSSSPAKFS